MDPQLWMLYLAASIGLSLTPGPNGLLALTHGALHGPRRTLFTIAGGALGFAGVIGLSMAGVGALLQASSHALVALKWVGGAWLVWLGIQVWRASPPRLDAADGASTRAAGGSLFRQGLLSAVSNPKAVLFYGAFLPQFIDPARGLLAQFAVMAGTFVAIECVTESVLAGGAHRLRPWLQRHGKRFNRGCGALFAGMGVALPLAR